MSVVIPVVSEFGEPKGNLELPVSVFGCSFNEALVHQVVVAQQSGLRAGTHENKNRAAVNGGGKKPWKQKGSGNARAGTSRSPLWRGGGATFAKVPRDYSQKINKKMYRGAMKSILSELIRQERLIVVDSIDITDRKTKTFLTKAKQLQLESALVVTCSMSEELYLSSRNLYKFYVVDIQEVDLVSLIKFPKVLMTQDALKQLESTLQ
jgi:large subunit ribosomal protein L4